jgi:glycerophosphoryl diester phosphodiesterase
MRGNAAEFPENTLPAFASAIELGARFIGVDVQLSADGVPMAIRDPELARTAGLDGTVLGKTAAELVRVDVGESGRFGSRFTGTHMPRLADVLGVLENRPEMTVFVEIGRHSLARFGHDLVLGQVIETLLPFRSQCVVLSSDLPGIIRVRQRCGLPIGWVLAACDDHSRIKFEALQPEFIACDASRLPPAGALWRGPWRWIVREIATVEDALRIAARGADFIATPHVRALGAVLREAARGG